VLESVLLDADAPTPEVGRPAQLLAAAPDDRTYVPAIARSSERFRG